MTVVQSTTSSSLCVGLNRDSKPFSSDDPLIDLENQIRASNAVITGDYLTVVLMQDMTIRSTADSITLSRLKHDIEGAITAVWRANQTTVLGTTPKIKLLLANLGGNNASENITVDAIKNRAPQDHITVVAGIGQSTDITRAAVATLSSPPTSISTIGSDVTADNMNKNPIDGTAIPDFFRVSPTNSDEARAAINYIRNHLAELKTVVLVKDTNPQDSYADTLASSFVRQAQDKVKIMATLPFTSPDNTSTTTENRSAELTTQFTQMHNNICLVHPDLVYFAGRGTDLVVFLQSLQENFCSLGSLRVITGDDASNVVGTVKSGPYYTVLFTALANPHEWDKADPSSDQYQNYQKFLSAFINLGFPRDDLDDGEAMMSHDAVFTAITAIRVDRNFAVSDPSSVAGNLRALCGGNMVAGSSGFISIGGNGDAIDKAMPVVEVKSDGLLQVDEIVWPNGIPLNHPSMVSPNAPGISVLC